MEIAGIKIDRRKFLAACGAGAAALIVERASKMWGADVTSRPARGLQIGMNLESLTDWGTEWAFVDVFKTSRPWISQRDGVAKWETGEPIALTPGGYPLPARGQLISTLMCREIDGHYPPGRYVCEFVGEGKLKFGFDARNAHAITPNIYEMDVLPAENGIFLTILESNHQNPVRDIRVWMPGFENGRTIFHPLFLKRLSPFKTIRFMDWQATNGSTLAHWKDRVRPDSARQNDPHGGAIEYMVELCNELNADAWFCMPHLADEDFIRQFAAGVKSRLKRERKIYIEWSNEVWNTMFEQTKWVNLQAAARGISHEQMVAERASRDWHIWHEVFGDQKNRVVRVAAGQEAVPAVLERILDQLKGEFDAVSCAAYFDVLPEDKTRFTQATTAEDVLRSAMMNIKNNVVPSLKQHGEIARTWSDKLRRHIPLVAYEGGQAITPLQYGAPENLAPWHEAAWKCQTHPMMKDAYHALLHGFADAGGELLVAFSYVCNQNKYGSWGHLRYQDDALAGAPKYAALLEWMQAHANV